MNKNKLNILRGAIRWILTEHINKKSAEETYDLVSKNSNYDEIVGFDERRDGLKELIRNENITDKDVLDIACGSGVFIDAVLNKKPRSIVGNRSGFYNVILANAGIHPELGTICIDSRSGRE